MNRSKAKLYLAIHIRQIDRSITQKYRAILFFKRINPAIKISFHKFLFVIVKLALKYIQFTN